MVDRALLVCPPSSSYAEGEVRALATKADFMALGDQYLTNLNSIAYELTTEGNKLRTDLIQKVAQMKWKTDLHLNKTEVRVNSVVEQLNAATTSYLRKLKRKAPSSCREEEVKRSKGDDGHDDQGPSHHEGETTPSEHKAAEASNPKPAPETSNQPQESKEQTAQEQTQSIQPTPTPIIDQNPLNPDTSEESSSPPQYFSQIPLIQRLEAQQNPTIAGSAELLKNTPEGLAILPK